MEKTDAAFSISISVGFLAGPEMGYLSGEGIGLERRSARPPRPPEPITFDGLDNQFLSSHLTLTTERIIIWYVRIMNLIGVARIFLGV